MKKILIFPAVLLLLAGAVLPGIAAAVTDSRREVSYHPMQSVALELSPEQSLTPLEKLRLVQNVVDIDPSQASMTEEEVYAAAEAGMEPYINAGIFQWFQPDHQSAAPKLAVDPADPSRHLVCWTVTYISKQEPTQALLLDLDDKTGQILSITYDRNESFSMKGVWDRNIQTLEGFSDIFFSGLGMAVEEEYQLFEKHGGTSVARYVFPEGGQIDLYAEGGGAFYVVCWF